MEEPTNKELMHYIKDIRAKIEQITEKDLPEINSRVMATNGSVAEVKAWKERATGGMYVVLIVVIPLLAWGLYQISQIGDKIRAEFSRYDVTVTK